MEDMLTPEEIALTTRITRESGWKPFWATNSSWRQPWRRSTSWIREHGRSDVLWSFSSYEDQVPRHQVQHHDESRAETQCTDFRLWLARWPQSRRWRPSCSSPSLPIAKSLGICLEFNPLYKSRTGWETPGIPFSKGRMNGCHCRQTMTRSRARLYDFVRCTL